jgi:hypothetical protein
MDKRLFNPQSKTDNVAILSIDLGLTTSVWKHHVISKHVSDAIDSEFPRIFFL